MRRSTLLLVEDDDNLREITRLFLEDTGWKIDTADTAESALEKFEPSIHGVLVTDLEMPGRGGMELIRTLHARHPRLPIIVVSAYGDRNRIDEALRKGATMYLQKPFQCGELTDALEDVQAQICIPQ